MTKLTDLSIQSISSASPYRCFASAQNKPHHSLTTIVIRNAKSIYQRPIPHHQKIAFNRICQFVMEAKKPIIIDSGCGTGLSTQKLAALFSDHCVIGIDKSSKRLAKARSSTVTNYLLVQGDLIDLWRLFSLEKLPIARHYLFFPNPWPKISHIKRRFHAHPVFKTMVHLAPYTEMRTNWPIYAEEWQLALETLQEKPKLFVKADHSYMTLFEKKYIDTACPVYVVTNELITARDG
jgi:tRNA (guanine-N7-)-methyltransferase